MFKNNENMRMHVRDKYTRITLYKTVPYHIEFQFLLKIGLIYRGKALNLTK